MSTKSTSQLTRIAIGGRRRAPASGYNLGVSLLFDPGPEIEAGHRGSPMHLEHTEAGINERWLASMVKR